MTPALTSEAQPVKFNQYTQNEMFLSFFFLKKVKAAVSLFFFKKNHYSIISRLLLSNPPTTQREDRSGPSLSLLLSGDNFQTYSSKKLGSMPLASSPVKLQKKTTVEKT